MQMASYDSFIPIKKQKSQIVLSPIKKDEGTSSRKRSDVKIGSI